MGFWGFGEFKSDGSYKTKAIEVACSQVDTSSCPQEATEVKKGDGTQTTSAENQTVQRVDPDEGVNQTHEDEVISPDQERELLKEDSTDGEQDDDQLPDPTDNRDWADRVNDEDSDV